MSDEIQNDNQFNIVLGQTLAQSREIISDLATGFGADFTPEQVAATRAWFDRMSILDKYMREQVSKVLDAERLTLDELVVRARST